MGDTSAAESQNRAVVKANHSKMDPILEPKHSPTPLPRAGLRRAIGSGLWDRSGRWDLNNNNNDDDDDDDDDDDNNNNRWFQLSWTTGVSRGGRRRI